MNFNSSEKDPYSKYDLCLIIDDVCSINTNEIKDENEKENLYEYFDKNFGLKKLCPFCHKSLTIKTYKVKLPKSIPSDDYLIDSKLWYCSYCAYWQFYHYDFTYDNFPTSQSWTLAISKIKQFQTDIEYDCKTDFAQHMRRNPTFWHKIHPTTLEIFVRDIFSSYYKDCEVTHIGKPYDDGVDVLFVDSGNNEWLIQVKRRENPLSTEGIDTIRNLLGVLTLENNKFGIVVSTADHFSYWANKAQKKALRNGYTIKLIDKNKIESMLDPLIPKYPWEEYFINENFPELTRHFRNHSLSEYNLFY